MTIRSCRTEREDHNESGINYKYSISMGILYCEQNVADVVENSRGTMNPICEILAQVWLVYIYIIYRKL